MRARGGCRGLRARALPAMLVAALAVGAVGAVGAVLVAPGAEARPLPPSSNADSGSASAPSPGAAVAGGRQRLSETPDGSGAVTTSPTPHATTGTAFVNDPRTEAQVATDLVVAIDARSGGRYSIVADSTNVHLLETWMDNEGGLWADNPLNTSLDAARYPHQLTTSGHDTGIPAFPDIQIGIDATATTLLTNHAYAGILRVLSEGTASCDSFARVVMASPWAASHYGGNPSHFCGSTGSSATPGTVATSCLRLRDRPTHHAARMPGSCGRSAPTARSSAGARPSHGPKGSAPARQHGQGNNAGTALGHRGRTGSVVSRRHHR